MAEKTKPIASEPTELESLQKELENLQKQIADLQEKIEDLLRKSPEIYCDKELSLQEEFQKLSKEIEKKKELIVARTESLSLRRKEAGEAYSVLMSRAAALLERLEKEGGR